MPRRALHALSLLAPALLLTACYEPPASAHAPLTVAADGSLGFQGRPVEAAQLQSTIEAAKPPGKLLVVEIDASPQAPMASVEQAVGSIKAAQAVVAFAASAPAP